MSLHGGIFESVSVILEVGKLVQIHYLALRIVNRLIAPKVDRLRWLLNSDFCFYGPCSLPRSVDRSLSLQIVPLKLLRAHESIFSGHQFSAAARTVTTLGLKRYGDHYELCRAP